MKFRTYLLKSRYFHKNIWGIEDVINKKLSEEACYNEFLYKFEDLSYIGLEEEELEEAYKESEKLLAVAKRKKLATHKYYDNDIASTYLC